jgi:uncharacterized protein (UPF0335 family)
MAGILVNPIFCTLASSLLTLAVKSVIDYFCREKLTRKAIVAILKHNIYQIYEQSKLAEKISVNKFSTALSLYDIYKELGGNGFIHEVMIELSDIRKKRAA